MTIVVTFDAGQTLVELDVAFLSQRLAERGTHVTAAALSAALPRAWQVHDELINAGVGHPWRGLMAALLETAGVETLARTSLVEWLWTEQPAHNLWRQPITGMVALARELRGQGARVAVLSNSEGGLAALLEDIGIADAFDVIIDSGRLGYHKPDPRIFAHTLEALGVGAEVRPVHIGDSWAADIAGARNVGWRAMWYGRDVKPVLDQEICIARDPDEARAALVRWRLL